MKLLSIQRSFYFVSRNRYSQTTYVMDIWVSQAIAYDQSMRFQLLLNYRLDERNISLKISQRYVIPLAFIAIKTLVGWKQCVKRLHLSMINHSFQKLIIHHRFSQIVWEITYSLHKIKKRLRLTQYF